MTTEEKAQKYDNAIGKAVALYKASEPMSGCNVILETLFPELKESEDEKVRKILFEFFKNYKEQDTCGSETFNGIPTDNILAWLEKQGNREIYYSQNHQDSDHPNGCIVLEDFNGGDGFYKVNLDYLNKKQIEEIEKMVKVWNKESNSPNENIKDCIGMCLTDADEQRFKDYNTNLKDCLDWLKKQGEQKSLNDIAKEVTKNKETAIFFLKSCGIMNANGELADEYKIKRDEQKPAELAKGEDYGIDGLWHAQRILEKTFGKVDGYQTDDGILSHECAISAVKELYKKKSAWSEEDECYMSGCIGAIATKDGWSFEEKRKTKHWLKSLKERIGE